MSDIVERLRDSDTTRRIGESYADVHHRRQADRNEAAEEITRLTAENEKLDEAMEMLLTDVRRTDLDMRGLKAENERLSAYAKRAAMDVLLCKDGNILLHEKNEKLRAALEPLACTCDRPNGAACSRSEVDCPFWNARAVLSASQPSPSPWRLIETAPTDGTVVLVFAAERDGLAAFQCTAAYHADAGWCVDELREVTHWMPLPPPPQKQNSND